MSKIRLYLAPENIKNFFEINDKEIIHKLTDVMRCKHGDVIYVFDGVGSEYLCVIVEMGKHSVLFERKQLIKKDISPQKKIVLGFPLIKEEKIEFLLQKTVELGVWAFIPFFCERSIHGNPSALKIERWQKIIKESVRQSERLWLPTLSFCVSFDEIVKSNFSIKFAATIEGKKIESVRNEQLQEILVIVGPEGDFSSVEKRLLLENNFQFITLASSILRVETAAIFGVGLLNYMMSFEGSDQKI